ncbi:hypothetical protein B0T21DRAFT_177517 [Apiosordaria backusii]|uniref:Uncharacterized protein n=1 Tax=Apiosordaria backusii TaxID=314023 RepID=A0AA40EDT1_9PEZI|nr:hypothetical protein B0T21DRAFT_177517 [Apiosordaria backusii]
MSLSNPDSAGTWNSKHRRVESAIRRLGISREEAAELQGYIKRLLDEDKAVYEGYPIESLLIHRYQTDWKHLRIWKEEPVVSVEPAFKRCVEAVRDGLNLSRFPISICPVSSQSSAPIRSSPTARQAGSGYSSWGESTSTTRSNQPSFPRLSPESPLYIRPHTRATSSNRAWESAPASKASPLESPSFCGGSDPGPSARSRKYPPIVERQYSLPLAYLRPRSSSSSRATSPFLPSGFPLPPYSPTTPYQPNRTSQNFFPLNHPNISDPPRDFTFTERIKRESYRTRSWCPKPHPIPCSTPSLIQPTTNPYNNSLTPTMDTITPTTTPRQRIPTRKPVPIPTPHPATTSSPRP